MGILLFEDMERALRLVYGVYCCFRMYNMRLDLSIGILLIQNMERALRRVYR